LKYLLCKVESKRLKQIKGNIYKDADRSEFSSLPTKYCVAVAFCCCLCYFLILLALAKLFFLVFALDRILNILQNISETYQERHKT